MTIRLLDPAGRDLQSDARQTVENNRKIETVLNALTAATSTYTPTNVTTDRSYDANATTVDEVADVLGTLIAELQAKGVIS